MATTKEYTGSDCTGSNGDLNRTLTLINRAKPDGFLLYVSGLLLSETSSYSIAHSDTGSVITFLNALFDDMEIVVVYNIEFSVSTVNYGNLFSSSRDNIVSLIKDNVSDPTVSSSEYRKWIYSREPDVKASDFKGFPFIIIHPAVLSFDEKTINGQIRTVNWGIQIEVITADREFGNNDGKGSTHLDNISNEIVMYLNNKSNSNVLRQNGLFFIDTNATSVVVESFNNTLIYRRSFMLSFKNKMKVYA